jgi:hypothetical protein
LRATEVETLPPVPIAPQEIVEIRERLKMSQPVSEHLLLLTGNIRRFIFVADGEQPKLPLPQIPVVDDSHA